MAATALPVDAQDDPSTAYALDADEVRRADRIVRRALALTGGGDGPTAAGRLPGLERLLTHVADRLGGAELASADPEAFSRSVADLVLELDGERRAAAAFFRVAGAGLAEGSAAEAWGRETAARVFTALEVLGRSWMRLLASPTPDTRLSAVSVDDAGYRMRVAASPEAEVLVARLDAVLARPPSRALLGGASSPFAPGPAGWTDARGALLPGLEALSEGPSLARLEALEAFAVAHRRATAANLEGLVALWEAGGDGRERMWRRIQAVVDNQAGAPGLTPADAERFVAAWRALCPRSDATGAMCGTSTRSPDALVRDYSDRLRRAVIEVREALGVASSSAGAPDSVRVAPAPRLDRASVVAAAERLHARIGAVSECAGGLAPDPASWAGCLVRAGPRVYAAVDTLLAEVTALPWSGHPALEALRADLGARTPIRASTVDGLHALAWLLEAGVRLVAGVAVPVGHPLEATPTDSLMIRASGVTLGSGAVRFDARVHARLATPDPGEDEAAMPLWVPTGFEAVGVELDGGPGGDDGVDDGGEGSNLVRHLERALSEAALSRLDGGDPFRSIGLRSLAVPVDMDLTRGLRVHPFGRCVLLWRPRGPSSEDDTFGCRPFDEVAAAGGDWVRELAAAAVRDGARELAQPELQALGIALDSALLASLPMTFGPEGAHLSFDAGSLDPRLRGSRVRMTLAADGRLAVEVDASPLAMVLQRIDLPDVVELRADPRAEAAVEAFLTDAGGVAARLGRVRVEGEELVLDLVPFDVEVAPGAVLSVDGGRLDGDGLRLEPAALVLPEPWPRIDGAAVGVVRAGSGLRFELRGEMVSAGGGGLVAALRWTALATHEEELVGVTAGDGEVTVSLRGPGGSRSVPLTGAAGLAALTRAAEATADATVEMVLDRFETLVENRLAGVAGIPPRGEARLAGLGGFAYACTAGPVPGTFSSCTFEVESELLSSGPGEGRCEAALSFTIRPPDRVTQPVHSPGPLRNCLEGGLQAVLAGQSFVPVGLESVSLEGRALVVTLSANVGLSTTVPLEVRLGLDGSVRVDDEGVRHVAESVTRQAFEDAVREKLDSVLPVEEIREILDDPARLVDELCEEAEEVSRGLPVVVDDCRAEGGGTVPSRVRFALVWSVGAAGGGAPVRVEPVRLSVSDGLDFSQARLDADALLRAVLPDVELPDGVSVDVVPERRDLRVVVDVTGEAFPGAPPVAVRVECTVLSTNECVADVPFDQILLQAWARALGLPREFEHGDVVIELIRAEPTRSGHLDVVAGLIVSEEYGITVEGRVRIPVLADGSVELHFDGSALEDVLADALGSILLRESGLADLGPVRIVRVSPRPSLELPERIVVSADLDLTGFIGEIEGLAGLRVALPDFEIGRSGIRALDYSVIRVYAESEAGIPIEPFILCAVAGEIGEDEIVLRAYLTVGECSFRNLLEVEGTFTFSPRRPLRFETETTLRAVRILELARDRGVLDLGVVPPTFTREMETGGALSEVLSARGRGVVGGETIGITEARLQVLDLDVVEGAEVTLDLRGGGLHAKADLDLEIVTTEAEVRASERLDDLTVRAETTIEVAGFELGGTEIEVTARYASASFEVLGMELGVTVPSVRELESSIEELLENLLSVEPEDLVRALEQILDGNFHVNPFSGFGSDDGGGGAADGGGEAGGGGEPGGGEAGGGEPGAGEPGAGDPGAGEPGAGDPGADEPGVSEPGAGGGPGTHFDLPSSTGGPEVRVSGDDAVGDVAPGEPAALNDEGPYSFPVLERDGRLVLVKRQGDAEIDEVTALTTEVSGRTQFARLSGDVWGSVGTPLLVGFDFYVHVLRQGEPVAYWFVDAGPVPVVGWMPLGTLGLSYEELAGDLGAPRADALRGLLTGTRGFVLGERPPQGLPLVTDLFPLGDDAAGPFAIAARFRGHDYYHVFGHHPEWGRRVAVARGVDLLREEPRSATTLRFLDALLERATSAEVYRVDGRLYFALGESLLVVEEDELVPIVPLPPWTGPPPYPDPKPDEEEEEGREAREEADRAEQNALRAPGPPGDAGLTLDDDEGDATAPALYLTRGGQRTRLVGLSPSSHWSRSASGWSAPDVSRIAEGTGLFVYAHRGERRVLWATEGRQRAAVSLDDVGLAYDELAALDSVRPSAWAALSAWALAVGADLVEDPQKERGEVVGRHSSGGAETIGWRWQGEPYATVFLADSAVRPTRVTLEGAIEGVLAEPTELIPLLRRLVGTGSYRARVVASANDRFVLQGPEILSFDPARSTYRVHVDSAVRLRDGDTRGEVLRYPRRQRLDDWQYRETRVLSAALAEVPPGTRWLGLASAPWLDGVAAVMVPAGAGDTSDVWVTDLPESEADADAITVPTASPLRLADVLAPGSERLGQIGAGLSTAVGCGFALPGSHAAAAFEVRAARPTRVQIDVSHEDFDPVLYLAPADGRARCDDDGGGGYASRIEAVLPQGVSTVFVTSFGAGGGGRFTLGITSADGPGDAEPTRPEVTVARGRVRGTDAFRAAPSGLGPVLALARATDVVPLAMRAGERTFAVVDDALLAWGADGEQVDVLDGVRSDPAVLQRFLLDLSRRLEVGRTPASAYSGATTLAVRYTGEDVSWLFTEAPLPLELSGVPDVVGASSLLEALAAHTSVFGSGRTVDVDRREAPAALVDGAGNVATVSTDGADFVVRGRAPIVPAVRPALVDFVRRRVTADPGWTVPADAYVVGSESGAFHGIALALASAPDAAGGLDTTVVLWKRTDRPRAEPALRVAHPAGADVREVLGRLLGARVDSGDALRLIPSGPHWFVLSATGTTPSHALLALVERDLVELGRLDWLDDVGLALVEDVARRPTPSAVRFRSGASIESTETRPGLVTVRFDSLAPFDLFAGGHPGALSAVPDRRAADPPFVAALFDEIGAAGWVDGYRPVGPHDFFLHEARLSAWRGDGFAELGRVEVVPEVVDAFLTVVAEHLERAPTATFRAGSALALAEGRVRAMAVGIRDDPGRLFVGHTTATALPRPFRAVLHYDASRVSTPDLSSALEAVASLAADTVTLHRPLDRIALSTGSGSVRDLYFVERGQPRAIGTDVPVVSAVLDPLLEHLASRLGADAAGFPTWADARTVEGGSLAAMGGRVGRDSAHTWVAAHTSGVRVSRVFYGPDAPPADRELDGAILRLLDDEDAAVAALRAVGAATFALLGPADGTTVARRRDADFQVLGRDVVLADEAVLPLLRGLAARGGAAAMFEAPMTFLAPLPVIGVRFAGESAHHLFAAVDGEDAVVRIEGLSRYAGSPAFIGAFLRRNAPLADARRDRLLAGDDVPAPLHLAWSPAEGSLFAWDATRGQMRTLGQVDEATLAAMRARTPAWRSLMETVPTLFGSDFDPWRLSPWGFAFRLPGEGSLSYAIDLEIPTRPNSDVAARRTSLETLRGRVVTALREAERGAGATPLTPACAEWRTRVTDTCLRTLAVELLPTTAALRDGFWYARPIFPILYVCPVFGPCR